MQFNVDGDFMPQTEEIRNQIYARFQQSQHPNSIAADLGIDPIIVFAAFVEWRRK